MSDEETPAEATPDYSDDEGAAADVWKQLPPEREFFATPYDPPVKALIDEMREKELIVRPSFQRKAVWDKKRQSKFVESILLSIPVPNLFFAEDDDGSKVVVDGQQRLLALKGFVENSYKLSGLTVLADLNGKRFDDLTDRQQRIIRNRTLRCLVISSRSDSEIRFEVFERLNTGGLPLNAQEVRHCVYRGALNDFLHDLVKDNTWLALMRRDDVHPRMLDCELVLRFFALRDTLPEYSPPLKTLLNEYMREHRNPSASTLSALQDAFSSSIGIAAQVFSDHPFRRAFIDEDGNVGWDSSLNRAVFDTHMTVMEGMDPAWAGSNAAAIRDAFISLCTEDSRFNDCVSRATADKSRMEYRLRAWADALIGLGADLPASDRVPPKPEDESNEQ